MENTTLNIITLLYFFIIFYDFKLKNSFYEIIFIVFHHMTIYSSWLDDPTDWTIAFFTNLNIIFGILFILVSLKFKKFNWLTFKLLIIINASFLSFYFYNIVYDQDQPAYYMISYLLFIYFTFIKTYTKYRFYQVFLFNFFTLTTIVGWLHDPNIRNLPLENIINKNMAIYVIAVSFLLRQITLNGFRFNPNKKFQFLQLLMGFSYTIPVLLAIGTKNTDGIYYAIWTSLCINYLFWLGNYCFSDTEQFSNELYLSIIFGAISVAAYIPMDYINTSTRRRYDYNFCENFDIHSNICYGMNITLSKFYAFYLLLNFIFAAIYITKRIKHNKQFENLYLGQNHD